VRPLDNPLCVALDAPDARACMLLARATEAHAGSFKIGLAAFASGGPELVREVRRLRPVFLDLKMHDIPAQVAAATTAARALGVAYLSVHASGGADMVGAAVEAAAGGVAVLAVTVLTSLDDAALAAVAGGVGVREHALRLAHVATAAGADGLVCSPHEVALLRAEFGARAGGGPLLVTPGIRAEDAGRDDQRRSASARAALDAGADIVVVGRPITGRSDPGEAARLVRAEAEAG
jgi:orotidine-5'-phosphate decarboxylase